MQARALAAEEERDELARQLARERISRRSLLRRVEAAAAPSHQHSAHLDPGSIDQDLGESAQGGRVEKVRTERPRGTEDHCLPAGRRSTPRRRLNLDESPGARISSPTLSSIEGSGEVEDFEAVLMSHLCNVIAYGGGQSVAREPR